MQSSIEWYREVIRGHRRGPLTLAARAVLRAISWPYGIGVWYRNRRFDRGRGVHRVDVPVVSVGNLTLGGTGKTPCVEYVASFYRNFGVQVAILSRGYGSEAGRNDEAMVLEENLPDVPHLQGADRVALAALAIEELESELLLLDDGFQHRRLGRSLDIVLIDATAPPHRDHLFPRGTLREPSSSLKRAGAIVLTRCDQIAPTALNELAAWVERCVPGIPIAVTRHAPRELLGGPEPEPAERLQNRTVAGVCGIGNPEAFRRTLADLGANVIAFQIFPDHHAYSRTDVDELRRWANRLPHDAIIATTHKDWVKLRLPELANRSVRAVRVGLSFISGQDGFDAALRGVLQDAPR